MSLLIGVLTTALPAVAAVIGAELANAAIRKMFEEARGRDREKTKKDLENKMDKAHQELKNKMKVVHEDFEKLQKSCEVQFLRADPEQEQGMKEEEIARALFSRLTKNFWQLSQRIQTLGEHVQEWRETTKNELHLLRAELERIQGWRGRKKTTKVLENKMGKDHWELKFKMKAVHEDFEKLQKSCEVQLLRADPEQEQGMKEEEIARALFSRLEKKFQELSQRIQTLGEDLKEWRETTKNELYFLRAELEKKLGRRGMKKTTKALEYKMYKDHQKLKNKMKAVHEDFEKLQKFCEVQLLRADPEQEQERKEEEIARALFSRLEENLQKLFQRIQTLEEDLKQRLETTNSERHLLRAELENKLGLAWSEKLCLEA